MCIWFTHATYLKFTICDYISLVTWEKILFSYDLHGLYMLGYLDPRCILYCGINQFSPIMSIKYFCFSQLKHIDLMACGVTNPIQLITQETTIW